MNHTDKEHRLLVLSEYAGRYRQSLAAEDTDGLVTDVCHSVEEARKYCRRASLLFGDPDLCASIVNEMPRLQWLQSSWAGVTPLLDAGRRDYRLTNVRGVFGPLMSEYVAGWMLAHERRLREHFRVNEERRWSPLQPGMLQGKTLALLGLGSIGGHLAATGRHFLMRVLGCSRIGSGSVDLDAHYHSDQLAEMVAEADYLVASLPSTPATRNLLDARVLSAMKQGSVLINVGRGDLIEDRALIEALNGGHLAAAILDVFRQEPLPPTHPFWQTENLMVTAHTSAPSFPEQILPILLENYRRFRQGRALLHEVDFERGY